MRKFLQLFSCIACFLLCAGVCQAGTPSTLDLLDSILWRGILPAEGYGHFHWKDRPRQGGPVTCSSNPFHTLCTATDGLPDIGPFKVQNADYLFEYAALKRVKLSLIVPDTWRENGSMPKALTLSAGDIELRFSLLRDKAFLVLTNNDPDGRRRYGQEALSAAPDSVSEYLGELTRRCPDCSAVLSDYLAQVGAKAPTEAKEVNQLLMDNPLVCSLLALRSTGDFEPAYQALLEAARAAAGNARH